MIKRLYEKSELGFSIAWIIAYCMLASIGDNLSINVGIIKVLTLPILIVLSLVLFIFIKKNGLSERYGLCKSNLPAKKMLYYIPLIILLTANFWFGFATNASAVETVLYVLSMILVGFLEEMIFRGFLFGAMAKGNLKSAIIVSSLTFGIGHIINLINGSGAELLQNVLQIIYAIAIGFAFVMIYCKTKSLIYCILTHSLFNAASAFSNEAAAEKDMYILSCILIAVIAGAYAVYIALAIEDEEPDKEEPLHIKHD